MGMNDRANERKAAKKADAARDKAVGDGWKGFVNVELNEQQKIACKVLRGNLERCWTVAWDLVGAGYKLTISADDQHGSFNFSMTCRQAKDVNHGLTLTGRGGTIEGALASFVYKHDVVLEGDWTAVGVQQRGGVDEDYVG